MRPRSPTASKALGRYRTFGALLQALRRGRGFLSAAALSKRAGLSTNYVSILERGEARPKSDTVRRLADALALEPADRARLFSEAKLAGEPTEVGQAIYERYEYPAVPGLVLWKHLPAALFSVAHDDIVLFDLTAEDLVADLVRALGSLLGWLRLRAAAPGRAQLRRLRTVAHRAFDQSLHLPEVVPNLGPINPMRAACDAASVLPRAWRNELFSRRDTTARLVLPLRKWAYFPRGFRGPPRLGAWLRDERLNSAYSFSYVVPEFVINAHDALVANRLWSLLDLTSAFGVTGPSAQEYDLTTQLSPYNGDVFKLQHVQPDIVAMGSCAPGAAEQRDALRDAAERVDLALRVYDLPDLAQRVLPVPRAEVEAALTRAVDLVGGLSVRFPGPPSRHLPSTPSAP
jgi:transcriptional regulator with XRE-family HTH domain